MLVSLPHSVDFIPRPPDLLVTGGTVAVLLLVPSALISGETSSWVSDTKAALQDASTPEQTLFWGSWALIICGKVFLRGGKYTVIAARSAFFFAFIDALRTVITSILPILVFGEPFQLSSIAALVLIACAFVLNGYGKHRAVQAAAAARHDDGAAAGRRVSESEERVDSCEEGYEAGQSSSSSDDGRTASHDSDSGDQLQLLGALHGRNHSSQREIELTSVLV